MAERNEADEHLDAFHDEQGYNESAFLMSDLGTMEGGGGGDDHSDLDTKVVSGDGGKDGDTSDQLHTAGLPQQESDLPQDKSYLPLHDEVDDDHTEVHVPRRVRKQYDLLPWLCKPLPNGPEWLSHNDEPPAWMALFFGTYRYTWTALYGTEYSHFQTLSSLPSCPCSESSMASQVQQTSHTSSREIFLRPKVKLTTQVLHHCHLALDIPNALRRAVRGARPSASPVQGRTAYNLRVHGTIERGVGLALPPSPHQLHRSFCRPVDQAQCVHHQKLHDSVV